LAEVRVQDGESIEAALRRFKREVLKAGIILEIKKRKHHESKRQRKKKSKEEAKRKAIYNANRPPSTQTKSNTNQPFGARSSNGGFGGRSSGPRPSGNFGNKY
jgi:small subunit ribosomal protein S21